jgi:hypothetical protein
VGRQTLRLFLNPGQPHTLRTERRNQCCFSRRRGTFSVQDSGQLYGLQLLSTAFVLGGRAVCWGVIQFADFPLDQSGVRR